MILCGPSNLNNGLKLILQWRLFKIGFSADLSRFYRSIHTTKLCQQVRLFFFFKNKDDPEPVVWAICRCNFGDSISSLTTELATREIICPKFQYELTSEIASGYRYCDDFLFSFQDEEIADRTSEDMKNTFNTFNFTVKMTARTGSQEEKIGVMGLIWSPSAHKDNFTVDLTLYPDEKVRGAQIGSPLSFNNIDNLPITRQLLSRLVGQIFEYLQVLVGPALAQLKICFSRLTTALPIGDWNTCCSQVSTELTEEIRTVLKSLVNFNKTIKPFPRAILESKQDIISRLIFASDAGQYSLGVCVYFIIQNNRTGEIKSKLGISRQKIHSERIPFAEYSALLLSAKLLIELLENIPFLSKLNFLEIIFATDSTIAINFLNPLRIFKNIRVRNVSHSIHKILEHFVDSTQERIAKIVHLAGSLNPSDKITKIISLPGGPAEIANSDLWRSGPPQFIQENWPEEDQVCLRFEKNKPTFFQFPPCQKMSKEDIEKNIEKLTSGSSKKDKIIRPDKVGDKVGSSALHADVSGSETSPIIPSVFPQEMEKPIGFFEEEIYMRLVTRFSSLQKLINTVKNVLRLTTRLLHSYNTQYNDRIAFLILAASSQNIFKIEQCKSWFPQKGDDNIIRAMTRSDGTENENIVLMKSPILISHRDKNLTKLLIRACHIFQEGKFLIHHSFITTCSRLFTGRYAVIIPQQKRLAKDLISNCTTCISLFQKPKKVHLSSSRAIAAMIKSNPVFNTISLDPVGPYTRKCGRKAVKFYLIFISCLVTASINIIYAESLSSENIAQAVQTHCFDYKYPQTIYSDAGTSVNIKRDQKIFDKYFCINIETKQVAAGHQVLNFVENRIKSSKNILKTIFANRAFKNLPNMDLQHISNSQKCGNL